jgi:HTH-type transcriptional regulator/antitoxin HipB
VSRNRSSRDRQKSSIAYTPHCYRSLTSICVGEREHAGVSTLIGTPVDLGAIIRRRRRELGLGQAELAKRIGVSRQWIIGVEHGRARAELGLVLRTLDALAIRLDTSVEVSPPKGRTSPDLDAIVAAARTRDP